MITEFEVKTKQLIDSLKDLLQVMGKWWNEFKIITQYSYIILNDKFAYELKKVNDTISKADKWEEAFNSLSDDDREMLSFQLGADTAVLKPQHLISHLFNRQNEADFAETIWWYIKRYSKRKQWYICS